MHYQKFKTSGIQGVFRHCERYKDTKTNEYLKFGNEDIDTSKTHLNYNLAPDREMTQYQYMKKRLGELTYREQKNNIICCSWIVTAPKNMNDSKELKNFFTRCYKEFCHIYGEENVVSAFVHMDETSPHLHFLFVPATLDNKLSASRTTNRKLLQHIHDDFQNAIDDEFGPNKYRIVTEEPEERAKGSAPVNQMKKALQSIETKIEFDNLEIDFLDNKIRNQTNLKKSLEGQIETLEHEKTKAFEHADMWKCIEQEYKSNVTKEKANLSKLRKIIQQEKETFLNWKSAAQESISIAAAKIQEFIGYADEVEQEFNNNLMEDVQGALGDVPDFPETSVIEENEEDDIELF
jgi:hypothetical protein